MVGLPAGWLLGPSQLGMGRPVGVDLLRALSLDEGIFFLAPSTVSEVGDWVAALPSSPKEWRPVGKQSNDSMYFASGPKLP